MQYTSACAVMRAQVHKAQLLALEPQLRQTLHARVCA
jgi:hypothetical protein